MKRILLAIASLAFAAAAHAQSYTVQQSGPVVPGHIVCFNFNGTIYDCGPGGGALAIGQTSIVGGGVNQNGGLLFDNGGVLGIEAASTFLGGLFTSPGPIGGVLPNTGNFTAITAQTVATSVNVISLSGNTNLPASGQQVVIVRQTVPGPATLILPSAALYPLCPAVACPQFTIKDGAGVAGQIGDAITVISADGKTIDGVLSYIMPVNFESATFVLDGVKWNAI
jgi:hypothetical protein